jgi:hypothetical protein
LLASSVIFSPLIERSHKDPTARRGRACSLSSVGREAREASRPLPSGGSPYSRGPRGVWISWHADWRTDLAADPDTHNLYAGVGGRCMICDGVIKRGRPVRRTISGGYVHDNC